MYTEMIRVDQRPTKSNDDGGGCDTAKTCLTEDWSGTPTSARNKTADSVHCQASRNVRDTFRCLIQSLAASGSSEGFDLSATDDQLNTVVHCAARLGCCVAIQPVLTTTLACAGNEFGVTPLHEAADRGNPDDVEALIAAGATLKLDDEGWTPLHAAAASMTADWRAVQLLVEAAAEDDALMDSKTRGGQNTALHLAASNDKTTSPARLIGELRSLDATALNGRGDTAFHSAARCSNPDSIVAMLDTFPSWSVDEEDFERRVMTDLLTICARRGNSAAVGRLIHRGADLESSEVLRTVVDESVRCSTASESDGILRVYHAVVDHALLWRCGRTGAQMPRSDSGKFQEQLRRTVMYLLTKPSAKDGRSVLEHTINLGANNLLRTILETSGVFSFKKPCSAATNNDHQYVTYDVTDMTPFSRVHRPQVRPDNTDDCSRRFRPKRSYLEYILSDKLVWREKGIIKLEPFRRLTKPLLNFSKRFYFVLGVLQLIFMCSFTMFYMPDWTFDVSLNGTRTLGQTVTGSSEEPPKWIWLIWPFIVLLYNGYMYFGSISSELQYTCYLIRLKLCKKQRSKPKYAGEVPTRILLATFDRLPPCGYPVAVFIWFFLYNGRAGTSDCRYFEVLAVIFLFGWITTFMFFSGISKHVFIFSMVLKEIVVKDIINSFMAVFVFTILAFSSALYVLRTPNVNSTVPADIRLSAEIHAYEVFASGLTMSEYIDYTIGSPAGTDGRRFYRLVFAVYVCFTALLLVNLLIAMMTHRYERAKRSAEYTWRFNGVAFGLRIERLISAVLRALCRCRRCDGRALMSGCYVDVDEPGRYLLDVRVTNSLSEGDAQQSNLLGNVSDLS